MHGQGGEIGFPFLLTQAKPIPNFQLHICGCGSAIRAGSIAFALHANYIFAAAARQSEQVLLRSLCTQITYLRLRLGNQSKFYCVRFARKFLIKKQTPISCKVIHFLCPVSLPSDTAPRLLDENTKPIDKIRNSIYKQEGVFAPPFHPNHRHSSPYTPQPQWPPPAKIRHRRVWTTLPKHPHRTTRERASRHIRTIARKCTEVHRQI